MLSISASGLLSEHWAMLQKRARAGDLQAKEILRLAETVRSCDGAPKDSLRLTEAIVVWNEAI